MEKKKTKQVIVILASLFLCAVFILGTAISLVSFGARANIVNALANEDLSDDEAIDSSNETMLLSEDEDKVLYLSDVDRIKHDSTSFSLGGGNARLFMAPSQKDKIPGGAAQAKIEGAWYTFEYGVYAHANSVVVFNISNFSEKYKYFSAYAGLVSGASKSDGILVRIDFSQDGKNWTTQPMGDTPSTSTDGTQFVGYNQDFIHFTYDVTGVKWIRLFANRNKNDSQDQAIWTDAKLSTTKDEGGTGGMSLAKYDEEIKRYGVDADITNPKIELLILQREFVSRVGQYALTKFTGESEDNKIMLNWLLNDLDSLREFMIGGTPHKGNYYNSLTVLSEIYKYNKKDLDDTTLLNNKFIPNRTFGELCRTMMFSVALTHDGAIGSYLQGSTETNKSIPLRRYAIFKFMYQTERFVATRNADGTWKEETMNLFGSLRVEEMRFIMSNIIDDESILWLNDYVQTRINASGKVGGLYTPHSYVRYTDPNYNNPVFYANANYDYFNKLFAVDYRGDNGVANNANRFEAGTVGENKVGLWDTSYTVPAGEGLPDYIMKVSRSGEGVTPRIQKVWMNFNNKFKTGSVCGGISKSGTNIRTSRGIPAHVIGQPGHAAILYYSKNAEGKGSWSIDNNVGGWVAATKNERHLLGWGNAAWQRNSGGGGTVVFFLVAQEALNDYDNFVKAEEYTWLAKVYQGDLDKQGTLYEKALAAQGINLDAWYGLVQTYKAKSTTSSKDFAYLAERIANALYRHPLPLHCLYKLFTTDANNHQPCDDALKDPIFTSQLKTLELDALTKAKASGSSAAREKANFILGATDTSVADFSFDGENAGCIVWASSYDGTGFSWKYSLDGKQTWSKEVTFIGEEPHIYQLSSNELSSISEEKDIYVYIVGSSPDNAYKIDVSSRPTMPDTLYANDWENRVIGVDGTYEWRYVQANGDDYAPTTNWIAYSEASPDCSGDRTIEVRIKGSAKKPASDGRIFTFTPDTDTADRKYISVSYLSMVEYSTQSQDAKRPNYAVNAIDGNAKTYWHTDYGDNIKNPGTDEQGNTKPYAPAYLTIKIDVPRWISGLEFVQYQYNASFSIFAKNVTVYISEDGENWQKAAIREGFEEIDDLKVVPFDNPVYGQYVKLELTALYETNKNDGVFTTVSMINLYEDTTKSTSPDGKEMPSLSEVTPNGNAFEGLGATIDEEKALTIGSDSPKSNVVMWTLLPIAGAMLVAISVLLGFCLKPPKKSKKS